MKYARALMGLLVIAMAIAPAGIDLIGGYI